MTITPEKHALHLQRLAYHEAKADYYRSLTRAYQYQLEAQRVQDKKKDSARYYSQLQN